MTERKTAEKILTKHMKYGNPHSRQDFINNIGLYIFLPHVLGAMEEYADQVASLRSPQWISVKERLPEDGAKCWVSHLLGQDVCMMISGKFYPFPHATHWMPLPEPPKI